jgi:predicted RNA methylase
MAATFKLTDEVRDVLNRSSIDGLTLKLPEQLDRKLYLAVAKVISGAGGKWSARLGLHSFSSDPRSVLGLAVATGKGVNVQQTLQAFYTPQAVAQQVIELAEIKLGMRVLEPSAGRGALALPAARAGGLVHCYEIDPVAAAELRLGLPSVFSGAFVFESVAQIDFLSDPIPVVDLFDAVVMNPPFTKGQALAHVSHAFHFLKPGGILVAIVPHNFWVKSTKKTKPMLDELVAATLVHQEEVPAGTFRESGTDVATRIIVLRHL